MKKTLVLAALMSAAFAMPVMPANAADSITKTDVDAVCFLLPLLPDCVAQWNEEWKANGYHWTPIPVAWWTCEMAQSNAGHLLDCDTDA